MDALISRADAIRPVSFRRKGKGREKPKAPKSDASIPDDNTLNSVAKRTTIPTSLLPPSDLKHKGKKPAIPNSNPHIRDVKLRAMLNTQSEISASRRTLLSNASEILLPTTPGLIEASEPLERTWRLTQHEVLENEGVGIDAKASRREINLKGEGSVKMRWTKNGRWMAITGRRGIIATVDWLGGGAKEMRVGEACRDITYLHSHHHIAVAQARHAFIYDQDLVELHRLKSLIEPAFLEFLPYHWLLVCAGIPGTLSYLDTSTGTIVAQHKPKLGPPTAIAQNTHNAVVYWGAGNGTVNLYTPSTSAPHVRLLAHLGPITALSVDPSTGGRYMATAGGDGRVKIWDSRNYNTPVREWAPRAGHATALEWSQRGVLAVAAGGSINVSSEPGIYTGHATPILPPLYMTHPLPAGAKPATSIRWQPFMDVLGIGHTNGLSTILIPGSGEPGFDSAEADPFETNKRRAEREVRGLIDKIHPDMITLDPETVGSLAPPSKLTYSNAVDGKSKALSTTPFRALPRLERLRAQGKADDSEVPGDEDDAINDGVKAEAGGPPQSEKEKMKMRGRNKTLKRYLRKKRKNVIDASVVALREKIQRHKDERRKADNKKAGGEGLEGGEAKFSALDRFRKA
ncbi:BING4CT-domain-containing protein [Hysterangium stoloniferum]|nr:BING4CT-domain-containing protein [Hysterangium stoloniferum]